MGWIADLHEKYAEPLLSKLSSSAKDGWEKFKIDSDNAFTKYLENACDRYSKIKTILYRTEPKYIYDFFEYPNLRKKQGEIINSKDINNLLDISHHLIIQGTGGIGKSTFMKHLFINELTKKDLIPIFIELKDVNDISTDYEICDFVYKKLYSLGCNINKNYMEYALQSGCFLFSLDGYDEITTEKQSIFFKKITEFSDRYNSNYFIISSRPYSEFIEFERYTVLSLCSFTKKQSISLIKKIDYDETIKKQFIKELGKTLYDKHKSFASNPLLLNIMLLTYDNYAEIPDKLHLFYSNAFETLYSKHDATKGGYRRELKSKLSFDSLKKVLSYFCFITYFQGKIEFSYEELISNFKKVRINNISFEIDDLVYDLVNSICIFYKVGLDYKFAHRSFQEYFTAVFLKELPDTQMSELGINLINKDSYRAIHDNTFNMLFDMCEDRFEQNILSPLLSKIETDCDCDNNYDYFIKRHNVTFIFDDPEREGKVSLFIMTGTGDTITNFIEKFSWHYRSFYASNQESSDAEEKLLSYVTEEMGYRLSSHIAVWEHKDNEFLYTTLKKTWIGKRIEVIANLNDMLKEKQTKRDLDLSQLIL